MKNAQLKLVL